MTHWPDRPKSQQERRDAGAAVLAALDSGGNRQALREKLSTLAPDFIEITTEVAYGDFWSRPVLTVRERALVTCITLCALGHERQLAGQLRSALVVGVTREEVVEAFMQMAVYAGWPVTINGLLVAYDVIAEHEAARLGADGGDQPSSA